LRFAYVAGAMANGIGSVAIVEAMARAGMLAFFGAAGLAPKVVEEAIDDIQARVGSGPWGFNLIHSPYEPLLEQETVNLYLRRQVNTVSASAFLALTLPLVRYRVAGIHQAPDGEVVTPNRVIAKVSRVEVASQFMAPPPQALLAELVTAGDISEAQARMAETIPVAQDITAEADSGGHTDNRPAITLLPTLLALRDRLQREHGYARPLRVGAAGGISTPHSAIAAFAMGADYLLTGSVNQACREAGTSDAVRQLLAKTEQADVIMAPAADMFEMGVELQVARRGTMFAMRAQKLYRLYREYPSLDAIPVEDRVNLEKAVFRAPLDKIYAECETFWEDRDPSQIERALGDPKHKMALVFRWYLGQSSRWANAGTPDRAIDYQVWCGPAMGAFNEWVKGSFLESWEERHVAVVARNIMYGAAVLQRVNLLRSQGFDVPAAAIDVRPRPSVELDAALMEGLG
jgi:PfaD family protein